MTTNDDNGDLIDVCVEMNDRLDCLMDSDGNVIKHQVVGNVNLKYKLPQTAQPQPSQYFYANIGNLEQTKTKIFNPLSTEVLDDVNGQIRVKLSESESKEDEVKQVGVLKYVWITQDVKQSLPFLISIACEYESENVLSIACLIDVNANAKMNGGSIKELSLTGSLKDTVSECIEHSELDNVDFVWSKDISKKFIWSLNTDQIVKQYKLTSKFKCDTPDNKLQLKIQFEIENFGISQIQINAESNNPANNASISKVTRFLKSGEILLRAKE